MGVSEQERAASHRLSRALRWLSLVIALAGFAGASVPVARAQSPSNATAAATELERRVFQARERGYWVIAEGDHLSRICRALHPDSPEKAVALRHFLLQRNGVAFIGGNPSLLVVGAKLYLPPDLAFAAAQPSPAATGKPAAAPPAAPVPATPEPGATPAPSPGARTQAPSPRLPPPVARAATETIEIPYVDRLIEGAAGAGREEAPEEVDTTPGQRFLSTEYRAESRHPAGGGRGLEQGFDLRYRTETLNYGDFYFDGSFRLTDPAVPGDRIPRNGGRATLYQERFPLVEGWLADSALGVLRTPPSRLVTSSYRIFLPTSILGGASTVVSDANQEWMAFGGEIGRLEGSATQSFEWTSGHLAGLGYTRRLPGGWSAGGQVLSLRGSEAVPDHESASVAVERAAPNSTDRLKLQVVADSNDRFAGWLDGDTTIDQTRHRYGVFHLDPKLSWGDSQVVNDQRGAYWRGDFRSLGQTLSAGADLVETNLSDDPGRSKTETASAYATFTLRIDRNLSVGAGATYANANAKLASAADSRTASGNAFATWNNALGLSRLDLTRYRTTTEGAADLTIDTLAWTQDWPSLGPVAVNSTLNLSRETTGADRTTRSSLGLTLKGPVIYDLSWDASVVYGRVETPIGSEDNVNVNATASWNFARNWFATAQLSLNTFDPLPAIPGVTVVPTLRDKRFLLGVRYEQASGVPYQSLGLRPGGGSGRVNGLVYFDDNADGVRQPAERGAANVTVYLDGRIPVTTDRDGRFSFAVVSPGSHALRILNEALPLPWMFDEDRGLAVQVPLRGETAVEIGLTKIRP